MAYEALLGGPAPLQFSPLYTPAKMASLCSLNTSVVFCPWAFALCSEVDCKHYRAETVFGFCLTLYPQAFNLVNDRQCQL